MNLYPHQQKAIQQLATGKILCGGTGSGKSIAALVYFYVKVCGGSIESNGSGSFQEPFAPRDLYIITTAKKRDSLDWEKEALHIRVSTDPSVSAGGIKMVVDSWNNIDKYKDVKDAFFIFDEQRVVGYGRWARTFIEIAKSNDWILLSATPGDTWSDYIPVFIANGFYKNKTEFSRDHIIYSRFAKYPKIEGYHNTGKLNRLRRQILIHMPYIKGTKRVHHNVIVEYDKDKYKLVWKNRWNPYTDEPIQESGALFHTIRRVVHEDRSRFEAILHILESTPRAIIFYNFDYELEILRGLDEACTHNLYEWNGHKHDPVPTDDSWIYLVQYTAGAEGWNCTTTDTVIFYSLNYSYRIMQQAEGRIDRINTTFKDLHYYILRSGAGIDVAVLRALQKKRNFNESAYLKGLK